MRRMRRRGTAILILAAILVVFSSVPADALTLQRTWTARLGTNGANGTITLRAYTNGTGSIHYALKSLRISGTYSVQIRKGSCAHLGSIMARLPALHTTTLGTVSQTNTLTSGDMYWIWQAARSPAFLLRIVSGTSIRCGNFGFIHATRVAVSSLGIDLPVIRGPDAYPPCRVAMYLASAAQPREPGITYIYAHARTGMFLPLLTRWRTYGAAGLIGRTVQVWTSDSYVSYYRVFRVRVTSQAVAGVTSLTSERLWLQTSTGPNTSYPKLIVEASRYKTLHTTYAASHPTPHPVSC